MRGTNIPMQQSVPPMPPVKPYEGVNSLPKFEVTENTLYRPIRKTGLIIEGEVVITREEFVACFNKWIRDPYDDAYERIKHSVLNKYGIQDESLGGDHGKE